MAKTLKEKIGTLSKKRQAKIEARTRELIAEEMTMSDLRKAQSLTQKDVAKKLNISQDNVSRLESRSDVLLSTLRHYVKSLGGDLRLLAEFPDRPPVSLTGLSIPDETKNKEEKTDRR